MAPAPTGKKAEMREQVQVMNPAQPLTHSDLALGGPEGPLLLCIENLVVRGQQRNLPQSRCSAGSTSGLVAPSRGASCHQGSTSSHGKGRTCLGLTNQQLLLVPGGAKDLPHPFSSLTLGTMSSELLPMVSSLQAKEDPLNLLSQSGGQNV